MIPRCRRTVPPRFATNVSAAAVCPGRARTITPEPFAGAREVAEPLADAARTTRASVRAMLRAAARFIGFVSRGRHRFGRWIQHLPETGHLPSLVGGTPR